MTPQERDLIERLFAKLAAQPAEAKDPEAVSFINDKVRTLSDPSYTLVHTIAVQEIGLQQAAARVQELEQHLAQARAAATPPAQTSFLGSLFGGGSRPAPAPQAPAPQAAYQTPVSAFGAVQAQPQGYQQQPVYQTAPPMAQAPAQGGGFMRSVLGTATGVAGGVLAAEAISSMFSHHGGGGFGGGAGYGGSPWGGGGSETVINETVVNNYYEGAAPPADNTYTTTDYSGGNYASNDSYDSGGGGDFGGGDWS